MAGGLTVEEASLDEHTKGQMDRQMDGQTDTGQMDRQTDGQTDGRTGGHWTDGHWTDGHWTVRHRWKPFYAFPFSTHGQHYRGLCH